MVLAFFSIIIVVFCFNYDNHGIDWPGTCNTSAFQSPIDINLDNIYPVDSSDPSYWSLKLSYSPVHIINLNSTKPTQISSGFSFNPKINLNIFSNFGQVSKVQGSSSSRYSASSLSFHYPAEHTISKSSQDPKGNYLLEVQITHISSSNSSDVLILSVFFQPSSQSNYFLKKVIDSYYSTIGEDIDCTWATNGWFVVKNFFTYEGSQTTPNCNEGVTWVILSDIVNATQSQLDFFSSKLNISNSGGNFRYTFPQNGRMVYRHMAGVFSASVYLHGFVALMGFFWY